MGGGEEVTSEYKNLIKQIIFQISRMLYITPDQKIEASVVIEGITMLHNLINAKEPMKEEDKEEDDGKFSIRSKISLKEYVFGQLCNVGILDHLSGILKKSSSSELFERNFKVKSGQSSGWLESDGDAAME